MVNGGTVFKIRQRAIHGFGKRTFEMRHDRLRIVGLDEQRADLLSRQNAPRDGQDEAPASMAGQFTRSFAHTEMQHQSKV